LGLGTAIEARGPFETAFTAASGNRTRLDDLGLSIATCLAVSAMNLDHTVVIKKGVPALERGRISPVARSATTCYGRTIYRLRVSP
jgi:hypothetical protein